MQAGDVTGAVTNDRDRLLGQGGKHQFAHRTGRENLAAIRNLAYGGGPLNVELVAEVRRRIPGSLITNTYGQSENTGWACSLSGEAYVANPLSCGWAVPTVDVCVRREDGSENCY